MRKRAIFNISHPCILNQICLEINHSVIQIKQLITELMNLEAVHFRKLLDIMSKIWVPACLRACVGVRL